MIKLMENEFYKVLPIFVGIDHNQAVLYSVIEGNNPGRVFVNNKDNPKTAFVYTSANFFYFGGDEQDTLFIEEAKEQIVNSLRNGYDKSVVVFTFTNEWRNQLNTAFADHGAIRINRKLFDFDEKHFNKKQNWRDDIGPGFSLKPMDECIAEMAEVSAVWGSVECFLNKSFGFCLFEENEFVSECHIVHIGNGEAELSVYTEEKYRNKGYATLTVCAVIEKCISMGLKPSWSCWDINGASYTLATRVGFVAKPNTQAHYWEEKN